MSDILVFRATSEDIEKINNNGFFNPETLGKDIYGVHYYGCEAFFEAFPEIIAEPTDQDSPELLEKRAVFKGLEKVDYSKIELPELEEL